MSLTFSSRAQHDAWLQQQSALPSGFRVASVDFEFTPIELPRRARMRLSLIALDQPTTSFALMFTRNAFAGAPITVGRSRVYEPTLQAILINNKISNVCAEGGVEAAETLCADVASALNVRPQQVLPSSTGIIGWQLPVQAMQQEIPRLANALQSDTIMPLASGIMTTDLYAKVRRVDLSQGSIVGVAKGAGMVEPNLATMLVYLLTDIDLPRAALRQALEQAVATSFNAISIDSDQSTSDTVALLSSRRVAGVEASEFERGLRSVCTALAQDVVRNGEGVHHVMQVRVSSAPSGDLAKAVGKAVVNSPLWQCAVCGNDPNIGRLVMAVGKCVGDMAPELDLSRCRMQLGEHEIFAQGRFNIDEGKERALQAYLKTAELYASAAPDDKGVFNPPVDYPPHERCVEITIDLGQGHDTFTVWGGDRSHEYISENADYRS